MRALVLQQFGRLVVEERPDPSPAEGEVVIRVAATGICGSDIHGFTGENGRRSPGQVMGHESAGRIAAVGGGVDSPRVGDVVTFNPVVLPDSDRSAYAGREQHCPYKFVIGVRSDITSAFADYVVVPARNAIPLPEGMPITHGALVEPLAVAVHAVRRARVMADDVVLVLGGGPIGQSVVLALRMAGIHQIAVSEVSDTRRALLVRLGVPTIDPRTGPLPGQVERLFGELATVAIDAVGVDATISDALTATTTGGSICLVGMGFPRLTLDAYQISTEERTLVGSFTYADRDFTDATAWLATVPELAAELISRKIPLEEANTAFTSLASGDDTAGKTLVLLDPEP